MSEPLNGITHCFPASQGGTDDCELIAYAQLRVKKVKPIHEGGLHTGMGLEIHIKLADWQREYREEDVKR